MLEKLTILVLSIAILLALLIHVIFLFQRFIRRRSWLGQFRQELFAMRFFFEIRAQFGEAFT